MFLFSAVYLLQTLLSRSSAQSLTGDSAQNPAYLDLLGRRPFCNENGSKTTINNSFQQFLCSICRILKKNISKAFYSSFNLQKYELGRYSCHQGHDSNHYWKGNFPMNPAVGWSVGRLVCHIFLKRRKVILPCSYRSTYSCMLSLNMFKIFGSIRLKLVKVCGRVLRMWFNRGLRDFHAIFLYIWTQVPKHVSTGRLNPSEPLRDVVIYHGLSEARTVGFAAFKLLVNVFDSEARYQLYRHLLNTLNHSGLMGWSISHLKVSSSIIF